MKTAGSFYFTKLSDQFTRNMKIMNRHDTLQKPTYQINKKT